MIVIVIAARYVLFSLAAILRMIYMRGMSVQTVHPPKMSKISKFGGWPWDRYGILEGA